MMACELCEHCNGPVTAEDDVTFREGYSYHKKCHKCYVCSETDLHDAEIFKGVIFCSSCSQRIFQGCSTARRTKNNKPRRQRSRSHRRRDRTRDRRPQQKWQNGVIELAGLNLSTDSDSRSPSDGVNKCSRLSKTLAISTELALQVGKEINENNAKSLKINSADMGIITDVTQELLQQIHCPAMKERGEFKATPVPESHTKQKPDNKHITQIKYSNHNKNNCSDLRIAELGTSTEIANMALRKKSEMPVILKSESGSKHMESTSRSMLNQDSEVSGDQDHRLRLDSAYSSLDESENQTWVDRTIGNILMMPYNCFKKNILNRSSLVSVLMEDEGRRFALLKKFKMLFYEDVAEHQRRGIKRLYSTINRRKTPYRLGWLQLVSNAAQESPVCSKTRHSASASSLSAIFRPRLCRHFKASHSYRCMRAHVMRLAGPTKSELACFRRTLKRWVAPHYLRYITNVYRKKYASILKSQGCGSDAANSDNHRVL